MNELLRDKLLAEAMRLTQDPDDAEDLAQEASIGLIPFVSEGKGDDELIRIGRKILYRRFISKFRKNKRQPFSCVSWSDIEKELRDKYGEDLR